jgi:hypothetical protein
MHFIPFFIDCSSIFGLQCPERAKVAKLSICESSTQTCTLIGGSVYYRANSFDMYLSRRLENSTMAFSVATYQEQIYLTTYTIHLLVLTSHLPSFSSLPSSDQTPQNKT